jgi:hypothetical protein
MLPKLRNLLKLKKPPSRATPASPSSASWEELFQQAQSLQQQGQLERAIELYGTRLGRGVCQPDRCEPALSHRRTRADHLDAATV